MDLLSLINVVTIVVDGHGVIHLESIICVHFYVVMEGTCAAFETTLFYRQHGLLRDRLRRVVGLKYAVWEYDSGILYDIFCVL